MALGHSQNNAARRTIAVLAGGASTEREISLRSGSAVAEALRAGGHRVLVIDPADREISDIDWEAVECPAEISDGRFAMTAVTSKPSPVTRIDAVFIALHGAFGEDGCVQELLEQAGMPFTGSGSQASAIAFSKSDSKDAFREQGVPTADARLIHFTDDHVRLQTAAEMIGYPLVVKPDRQGSSLGVTIVPARDKLLPAIEECFRFDSVGLIERAIPGSEWTVAVLDNEPLPPIRIESGREFYDYAAKYDDDRTQYLFDGDAALIEQLKSIAVSACRAVGAEGVARVDFRVDPEGRPWALEVNTIPGMTGHSLVPKAAAQIGMSMTELCDRALRSAMGAHQRRHNGHGLRDRNGSLRRRRAG
jgi:D-alanine-D-alanine ligase